MSANIFISFAGQDLKVAFTLCKALESRGFKCWISSRDILPGENFQVAIVRAIRTAKMMLLVFTGNSNNSEEMTKELALASQHKLIVVPLRIEDVAPNDAFAYEFATRQWIDFFADWETAINQLAERIAQAIPIEAEVAPVAAAVVAEPLPPPNPHIEPVEIPPAALEPAPVAPAPVAAAPVAAPPPVKEAVAVATIERAPELKQPDPKPAAPEPVKAAPAAAPAAKAATPAPAKPVPPVAKAPAAKAPVAPGEKKKGAPIGLFVGIGVVVAAIVAAAVVLPGMLANKPSAAKPAAVVATAPATPATPAVSAPPVAAPAPAGVVAQPASPDSNALAAAGGNTLADPNAPAKPRHVRPKAAVASHANTEVPF
jgi:hypothetical protein